MRLDNRGWSFGMMMLLLCILILSLLLIFYFMYKNGATNKYDVSNGFNIQNISQYS